MKFVLSTLEQGPDWMRMQGDRGALVSIESLGDGMRLHVHAPGAVMVAGTAVLEMSDADAMRLSQWIAGQVRRRTA